MIDKYALARQNGWPRKHALAYAAVPLVGQIVGVLNEVLRVVDDYEEALRKISDGRGARPAATAALIRHAGWRKGS